MIPQNKISKLLLSSLLISPTILMANTLNNKQLAGPPAEFELMRQAQAEQTSFSSKTALIPVTLQESKSGNWLWNSRIAIDSLDTSFVVFANGSKDWQIELINPVTKQVQNIEDLATEHVFSKYGLDQNNYAGDKYTFDSLQTGNWNISIKTAGEPEQFEGFILVSSNSKYKLSSYKTNFDQIIGHKLHFVAQSTTNEETIEVLKDFNPIKTAFMAVTTPNGIQQKVAMYDDGLHGDSLANDGLFGGDFSTDQIGDYTVQINALGQNPDGTPFYRTAEHSVPVIAQTITMNSKQANSYTINDNRLNISLDIENHAKSSDKRYRIIAEVWGKNNTEKTISKPVSWISTITNVDKGQLNIELDARWIALSKTSNSFELRNLRIEDADNFIPLVTKETLTLNIASLPKAANKSFSGNINQEMLMGVRPTLKSTNKAGSKLLLVHGYCSSDVWGPFSGQFSNSATFQDFDQNRTHDDFANRIKAFGSSYSSYGIVAHSQGGAASLHLYTYYWSGLDNASGNRLIQSVGTPYLGTPLAGNLAAIGDVFGAGCGKNNNLTTSGSATWLAGIPTWARNAVNYHTTSFTVTSQWWINDYCNFATDLILDDPEDGVIEKSKGQLSGGINRGHKVGWCHTLDMDDDGQTSDSSRNATMSANASR